MLLFEDMIVYSSYIPKGDGGWREASRYIYGTMHSPLEGWSFYYLLLVYLVSAISVRLIESVSRDLMKCIFRILLQIILDNNFLSTSKLQQVKLRRFLDIFWQSLVWLPPLPQKSEKLKIFQVTGLDQNAHWLSTN